MSGTARGKRPAALDIRSALAATSNAATTLVPSSQLSPTSPLVLSPVTSTHKASREPPALSKNVLETRKLLQFLLDAIRTLLKDRRSNGVAGSRKPRRRDNKKRPSLSFSSSSEDEQDEQEASGKPSKKVKGGWASQALQLCVQLKDLLLLSKRQKWQLFSASSDTAMAQVISVFSQLVIEASHRLVPASPSSPPYALQSVLVDTFSIIYTFVEDKDRTAIVQAIIFGLSSFADGIQYRLLRLLNHLLVQHASTPQPQTSHPPTSPLPTIAITSEEPFQAPPASSYLPANHVQQHASLMPLLLATLFEIKPEQSSYGTLYALHGLLHTLIRNRPELPMDVLHAVATSSSIGTKERALAFLATYWPSALGTPVVGSSLPLLTYASDCKILEKKVPAYRNSGAEWVLWKYADLQGSRASSLRHGKQGNRIFGVRCLECHKPISGYGLRCISSQYDAVHLHCYSAPEGSAVLHFVSDTGKTKLSFSRSCLVQSNERASVLGKQEDQPVKVKIGYHRFHLASSFSTTVCFLCREPMWGILQQGYRCSSCAQCSHLRCLNQYQAKPPACLLVDTLPASMLTISFHTLLRTFDQHYNGIPRSQSHIQSLSALELLLMHDLLRTQLYLLENGIASATLILAEEGEMDLFDLYDLVSSYEDALGSPNLHIPPILEDYCQLSGADSVQSLLYKDTFLDYAVARLRAGTTESFVPSLPASYEASDIRAFLSRILAVKQPFAVERIMQHLQASRRVERLDGQSALLCTSSDVTFPLPTVLLPSAEVALVLKSISACLASPSLSTQEAGLLLLSRQCRPSSLTPPLALREVLQALLRWIADDEALVEVAKSALGASDGKVPGATGVATATSSAMSFGWSARRRGTEDTAVASSPRTPAHATESILARDKLVSTYAAKWMETFHDLDPLGYAETVFEGLAAIAAHSDSTNQGSTHAGSQDAKVHFADRLLRNIIKLLSSNLLYSAFDNVLARWLDEVLLAWTSLANASEKTLPSFRSLSKLFGGGEQSHTKQASRMSLSNMLDALEDSHKPEPWSIVWTTAEDGLEGLERALQWIRIIVLSGAVPPAERLQRLHVLAVRWKVSFETRNTLQKVVFLANLQRPIEQHDLVDISVLNFLSQTDVLTVNLRSSVDAEVLPAIAFVKRTFATVLTVCGIQAQQVVEAQLATSAEVRLRARRQSSTFGSPTPLSSRLTEPAFHVAVLRLVQCDVYDIRTFVARFYNLLLSPASRLDGRTFYADNGQALASAIFRLFENGQPDLTGTRMDLLLRLLANNPGAFNRLLALINGLKSWEQRFISLESYFNIVTEITISHSDPTLLPGLQELCPLITTFFTSVYDADEHVRTKLDVLITSLQQRHFERMASCFERKYAVGNEEEQDSLSSFALKIHDKLPRWQVLSFRLLLLTAMETSETIAQASSFQILALASLYAAAGHPMSSDERLNLKLSIVKALGFRDAHLAASIQPEGTDVAYGPYSGLQEQAAAAILPSLKRILDSPKPLMQPSSLPLQASTTSNDVQRLPVGSAFLDIVPVLVTSGLPLATLPYLTLRDILESLQIIVYKADLEDLQKQHTNNVVNAIQTVTALLLVPEVPCDCKEMVLTLAQLLVKRSPHATIPILGNQVMITAEMMAGLTKGDALYERGDAFLLTAFKAFSTNGLFVLLFKNLSADQEQKAHKTFFAVLAGFMQEHEALRDAPIRDVMKSFFDIGSRKQAAAVLASLSSYITAGYHTNMPPDVLSSVTQFLIKLVRWLDDWAAQDLQADCLLRLCTRIIRSHRDIPDFLQASAAILRKSVSSFVVTQAVLQEIVDTFAGLNKGRYGNIADVTLLSLPNMLVDGLRQRQMHPSSLIALANVYLHQAGFSKDMSPTKLQLSANAAKQPWLALLANDAAKLAHEALGYISTAFSVPRFTDQDLDCLLAVAKLFVVCAVVDARAWQAVTTIEPRTMLFLSNLVNIAILTTFPSSQHAENAVEVCLPQLDSLYSSAAQEQSGSATPLLDTFISFRSALLLLRVVSNGNSRSPHASESRLMNAFWPSCETMLTIALIGSGTEQDDQAIRTIAFNSFSDTIIFLSRLSPPTALLLEYAPYFASLLEEYIASMDQPASQVVIRALKLLNEEDAIGLSGAKGGRPEEILKIIKSSLRTDLMATCKLRHMAQMLG